MSIFDNLLAKAMMGGGGGGGGGDFSTAEVTVTVANGVSVDIGWVNVTEEYMSIDSYIEGDGGSITVGVVLYKGSQYISIYDVGTGDVYDMSKITVTGDLEKDEYGITITGNGTITIS